MQCPGGTVLSHKKTDLRQSGTAPEPARRKKHFREVEILDMLLWFRITKDSPNETLLEDSCHSHNRRHPPIPSSVVRPRQLQLSEHLDHLCGVPARTARPSPTIRRIPQPPNPGSALLMPNTGQGGTSFYHRDRHQRSGEQYHLDPLSARPTSAASRPSHLPDHQHALRARRERPIRTAPFNVASGNTIVYYAFPVRPSTPAPLSSRPMPWAFRQGDILLVASVPSDPNNPSAVVYAPAS